MPKCRTCQAEIVWVKTARGRSMPVDAGTIEKDDTGKYPAEFDPDTMTSHFSTCKDADTWRKK
jgi:hypothetical protein